jgi:hypothetical protein
MSKSAFYLRPHGNFVLVQVSGSMLLETRELRLGLLAASATDAVRLILGIKKGTNLVKF